MSTANEGAQQVKSVPLCSAVTTTGIQTGVIVAGYENVEVEVVAVGTIAAQAVTFKFQGSMDGTNYYDVGYERIDATASPARAVTGITLTPGNGTIRQVFKLLDQYRYLAINPSANTLSGTGAGLSVTLDGLPI